MTTRTKPQSGALAHLARITWELESVRWLKARVKQMRQRLLQPIGRA